MPLASDSQQVKCGTSGQLKRYFRTHQMGWLVGRGRCRCAAAPLFVQILPVVLGYRTNMAALGWKWESRLSIVTDLLTAATSPDANDANTAHCKAVAGHQGIEAEAISWQGLHYAAVDWCWGRVHSAASSPASSGCICKARCVGFPNGGLISAARY